MPKRVFSCPERCRILLLCPQHRLALTFHCIRKQVLLCILIPTKTVVIDVHLVIGVVIGVVVVVVVVNLVGQRGGEVIQGPRPSQPLLLPPPFQLPFESLSAWLAEFRFTTGPSARVLLAPMTHTSIFAGVIFPATFEVASPAPPVMKADFMPLPFFTG
jgi:hypothetical protein